MIEKWIVRHWIALCIGCVLNGIVLRIAYAERGYVAMGAEWLIIPIVFTVETFCRSLCRRKKRRCRNLKI